MANLPETPTYEAGIYQIEVTDPVQGGVNGVTNTPIKQLANRTNFLKGNVDNLNLTRGGTAGVRQGVITAMRNALTGVPIYIEVGANNVTIKATPEKPFVFSITDGFSEDVPVTYYGYIEADIVISTSVSANRGLLTVSLNPATGLFSFGFFDGESGDRNFGVSELYGEEISGMLNSDDLMYSLTTEKTYEWTGVEFSEINPTLVLASFIPGDAGSLVYTARIGRGLKSLLGPNDVPTGTVHAYAGNIVSFPDGYLFCNGAAVSRSVYWRLFNAIGTIYGAGNGTTTFNLPDLRGEFIRGLDSGRGVDTGRTLGSAQSDELKSHDHSIWRGMNTATVLTSGANSTFGPNNSGDVEVKTTTTGGSETRPRNIAMSYIIKF